MSTDWVLLSAVRSGENIKEYIDSSLINSVNGVTSQPFYHQKTAIGALVTGSSGFDGKIARVIIYNRALNDTERQAVETCLSGQDPL
ncbi:MAG: LamG-like jellyroll fold domain-containing protein [Sedimentisphaeraceae bacterium JB056]